MSAVRASAAAALIRRLAAASQASTPGVRGLAAAADGGSAGPPPVLPPVKQRAGRELARQGPIVTDVVQTQGDPWSEVTIRETGERYWWNETTGETTAVGEPRPTAAGRVQPQHLQQPPPLAQQPEGAGLGLGRLVAMGAGVGLAFGLMGKLLGG